MFDDLPLFSGQPPTEEELPVPSPVEKPVTKRLVKCKACQDTGAVGGKLCWCWCSAGDDAREKARRDGLFDSVRLLSSGTIATLSGHNKYADIEKIHERFMRFTLENMGLFSSWNDAWKSFWPKESERWKDN